MDDDGEILPVDLVTLLVAEDLFRFYHVGDVEIRALKGISLMVEAGEIVALTGPSGSGKSTLMSCLGGLDEPDGGTVDICGRRMTRQPEAVKAAIRDSSLGLMAQRGNLFPHLTVAENVRFALALRGRRDALSIDEILLSVGMAARANAYPNTLSGGEIARAGLAVSLAVDAPLILADEPTAEVDEATERVILNLLVERSRAGKGALIATHSPAVEMIATRTLHLTDGRFGDRDEEIRTSPAIVEIDHDDADGLGRSTRINRKPLIEGRQISRDYRLGNAAVHAVEAATLTVHEGDRVAVTGASGSGKSTLLKMLAGLVLPSSGVLSWFGENDRSQLRPSRIGVVFQEPSLIPSLTVRQNVDLPLQIASKGADRPRLTADEALNLLSLGDLADKWPDELSGGQMQRVAFARALVTNPEIILADEPTGQLDRPTGRAVMASVLEALDRNGTTLLVTTHDERLAATMDSRFHMEHGHLAAAA